MDGYTRNIVFSEGDARMLERNGLTIGIAAEPSLPQARAGQDRRAAWRNWLARLWAWLVEAGEARARARMRRGYHL